MSIVFLKESLNTTLNGGKIFSEGVLVVEYDKEVNDILDNLKVFEMMYDKMRFVDPLKKRVLVYEEGNIAEFESSCYDMWNKNKLCKNCISMRAFNENKTFVKMEHDLNKIYMVTAIPVKLSNRNIVIELLKDATISMGSSSTDDALQENMYVSIDSMNDILLKDSLMNIYNRRYINEVLPVEANIAKIINKNLWVMIADIDFFKKINDAYGHLAGDSVLKEFAKILENCLKDSGGWCARYGGEEFLISVVGAIKEEIIELAETIRTSVESHIFYHEETVINVTVSFGICSLDQIERCDMFNLIDCADKKLYLAKQNGRNRIEI